LKLLLELPHVSTAWTPFLGEQSTELTVFFAGNR
jgi:hypothetical protein